MGTRSRRRHPHDTDSDANAPFPPPVVVLSSSDDDEANKDLSLEILERARRREGRKDKVVDLTAEEEVEVVEKGGKKKRRKRGRKEGGELERVEDCGVEMKDVDLAVNEQPIAPTAATSLSAADSVVIEVNEAADNVVLRKLLRAPRYFDLEGSNWKFCYNCNAEGHTAAACTVEKRKKPCFVCGLVGHNAKNCSQGHNCSFCKRRGHAAKDCPDKQKKKSQDSKFCLRCGELGHDMSVCTNDYAPEDLKEMQCYVCKQFGHLCCVESADTGPRVVACYNCGLPGHSGIGCAKSRYRPDNADSSALCYVCGQEGHFARGCTEKVKHKQFVGPVSTPTPKSKRRKESTGTKSAPNVLDKPRKKKSEEYERKTMSAAKSRNKGGWIVDDPGDYPCGKYSTNGWASPSRSSIKGWKSPSKSSESCQTPTPRSAHKKHVAFPRTPHSSSSASHYYPADRASRFSYSGDHYGRR